MPRIAVILGAGPGLSSSLATALSKTHNLLLLSRSLPGSLPSLNLTIPSSQLHAASSDGSRPSLETAFKEARSKWPESRIDVGIFNTGGTFSPGPFLEQKVESLQANLDSGVVAAFNFAQVLLPEFLENEPDADTGARGNLVFTGATRAIRGGAIFSAMAPGMFARRALSQSLAREFGPKDVHVSHVIVDGQIQTPKAKEYGIDPNKVSLRGSRGRIKKLTPSHSSLMTSPRHIWR